MTLRRRDKNGLSAHRYWNWYTHKFPIFDVLRSLGIFVYCRFRSNENTDISQITWAEAEVEAFEFRWGGSFGPKVSFGASYTTLSEAVHEVLKSLLKRADSLSFGWDTSVLLEDRVYPTDAEVRTLLRAAQRGKGQPKPIPASPLMSTDQAFDNFLRTLEKRISFKMSKKDLQPLRDAQIGEKTLEVEGVKELEASLVQRIQHVLKHYAQRQKVFHNLRLDTSPKAPSPLITEGIAKVVAKPLNEIKTPSSSIRPILESALKKEGELTEELSRVKVEREALQKRESQLQRDLADIRRVKSILENNHASESSEVS